MELITTAKDHNLRCIDYYLNNNLLLTGSDIALSIYNTVFTLDSFKSLGKNKIVIVTGKDDLFTFNVHPNVFVTNNTTYQEYFNAVKDLINNRYDQSGYLNEITNYFIVKVWDMDHLQNSNIKIKTRSSFNAKTTLNSKRMYSTKPTALKTGIADNNKLIKTGIIKTITFILLILVVLIFKKIHLIGKPL